MNVRILHCKRALRSVLLILLLGVAGMSNVLAYDFEADNLLYTIVSTDPILFADENVKSICVANWDTNGDGELSYDEAAAVTDLGWTFNGNGDITSFNELQYFVNLTSILDWAFNGCSALTSIEIPNSVTSIEDLAFGNCSALTSIEIPNSVTSIVRSAFSGCSGLTQIVVENGNSVYDSRDNCNAIIETATNTLVKGCKTTRIPAVITTIGNSAFNGCTTLTTIDIPNSVTSIASSAFEGCSGLTQIVVENGNSVYDSRDNCNAIIETATNSLIVGCKTTVIPNTVTSIGGGAFGDCYSLTSIEIPNSVTSIGGWAFNGCSALTSIEIPNSVTSIGGWAFEGCTGLTSIIVRAETPPALGWDVFYNVPTDIPVLVPCGFEEAYTSISWGGFSNIHGMCDGTVTVAANPAEGGTVTGGGSFEGGQSCTVTATANEGYGFANWTENGKVVSTEVEYNFTVAGDRELVANFASTDPIVFADDNVKAICVANWDTDDDGELSYAEAAAVTNLGGVFNDNGDITSFDELQYFVNLTSIGESAFAHCGGLTSIEIPNSVTSIGRSAFQNCSALTSIEIPNSVTSIGGWAFNGCSGLISIEIPNSVTTIREGAFSSCSYLTSIEIPNSVTSIGGWAFNGCSALTSIEIPNSVTSIGTWAFEGCTGLTSIIVRAETPPALGNGYVFYGVPTDIPVLVPCGFEEAYTSISWGGFSNIHGMCDGTVTVAANPAEGGTVTGGGSFEGGQYCTVTATPNEGYAFINWTENGSVVSTEVEYNFTVAGDRELVANFVSTPIVFADDNVKAICVANWDTNGDGELSYAEAAAVTNLGGVFSGNIIITSFNELQYFVNLTSIRGDAFQTCSALTSIEIPNSVTSIGENAFAHCGGLTSIEIPNSVTTIGDYAFFCCTALTSIEIPNSVTTIGEAAFVGCTGLTSIVIPSSVTTIGEAAFVGCTGLTSIVIPISVTTIGEDAFGNCTALTSIEIPNSVTSIGGYAFYNCYNLTSIKVNALIPPAIGDEVFNFSTCPIYVPYESLQAYLSEWSQYEDRIRPFLQRSVAGYGESANGQWAFIASPLADNMEATAIENMTADDYDLYSFNQSEELEWRNHKYEPFELVNGTGYLYANTDDVELVFKGTFNEDETKETDLVYDAAADFAGWNLVGNPFPYAATVDRSHYVMNAEGTALEPTALSEGTSVAPCTGVMVKADTEGETVTFAKAMRQGTANNGLLRIAVPDGDKAIVSFNAGDRLEKFGFGNQKATISIPQGGKDYAIAYSEGKGETPLNFKAAKNGEYTLTVDMENVNLAYLHLIDNLTGADVDLLVSPEYTFTAKTTDYASRFRLLFSANENGDDTTGAEGDSFAFIDAAGNIVVDGAEVGSTMQIVDVTGRVVRVCTDVARNVSTSGMTTGVYVLRLINGDDVKTQKIVID